MSFILDILYPRKCVGCQRRKMYLCDKCRKQIKILEIDYQERRVEGRIGLFKYDGVVKELLKILKYDFVSDTADEIGDWMWNTIRKEYPNVLRLWKREKYVVVPVPLHWRRENWRGFNQASLIALKLGERLGLEVDMELVERIKLGKPQSRQKKEQRLKNVENIFKLIRKRDKLIIFDDVWTTGATIKSLIKILPKSTKVWILTVASGI